MDIVIKGKSYKFEFGSIWGPLYLYEDVVGEKLPFNPRKTLCMHIMFWCVLVRANAGFDLPLDTFLEALNDLKLANKMMEYYQNRMAVLTDAEGAQEEKEQETNKKKASRRMKSTSA